MTTVGSVSSSPTPVKEVRGVKVVESDQMYNFSIKLYMQGMLSQKSLQNM